MDEEQELRKLLVFIVSACFILTSIFLGIFVNKNLCMLSFGALGTLMFDFMLDKEGL